MKRFLGAPRRASSVRGHRQHSISSKRPRTDEKNEANSEAMKQPRLDKGKRRADAVEVIVISSDEEDDRTPRVSSSRAGPPPPKTSV